MSVIIEFLYKLFDASDYPARWHCGNWSTFEGWLQICSDIAIVASYYSIPLILFYVLRNRPVSRIRPLMWMFAAFIFLCGTTHLMDAVVFWWPAHRLGGTLKFLTAVISVFTAVELYLNIPTILAFKSIDMLEHEIVLKSKVEKELRDANKKLNNTKK